MDMEASRSTTLVLIFRAHRQQCAAEYKTFETIIFQATHPSRGAVKSSAEKQVRSYAAIAEVRGHRVKIKMNRRVIHVARGT